MVPTATFKTLALPPNEGGPLLKKSREAQPDQIKVQNLNSFEISLVSFKRDRSPNLARVSWFICFLIMYN